MFLSLFEPLPRVWTLSPPGRKLAQAASRASLLVELFDRDIIPIDVFGAPKRRRLESTWLRKESLPTSRRQGPSGVSIPQP